MNEFDANATPPAAVPTPQAVPTPPAPAAPMYAYPYPYPLPPMPAAPDAPVPPGRHTATIWLVSLVTLTVLAVAAALGGGLSQSPAPTAGGTIVYQNSLATDDGAWTRRNDSTDQCTYANGGLDAVALGEADLVPQCTLSGSNAGDLRLSVDVLPQAPLNFMQEPVIFVHGSVAILFDPLAGAFSIYDLSLSQRPLLTGFTDQWHTSDQATNTVVVQVQGDIYTIALNNAQIYQGDLNGSAVSLPTSGTVGLGAWQPLTLGGAPAECAFANFSLTTP
jgi:hypothetical protein